MGYYPRATGCPKRWLALVCSDTVGPLAEETGADDCKLEMCFLSRFCPSLCRKTQKNADFSVPRQVNFIFRLRPIHGLMF